MVSNTLLSFPHYLQAIDFCKPILILKHKTNISKFKVEEERMNKEGLE